MTNNRYFVQYFEKELHWVHKFGQPNYICLEYLAILY